MFHDFDWVAATIAAHPDRQIVGRTRLQKTIKLLQRLGLPTDYGFSIHFYGPYSEGLQSDIALLEQFGMVKEEAKNQAGNPYFIIHAEPGAELPDVARFQSAIGKISEADAVVLELAATYDAFRELGADHNKAMERLRQKKGDKCDDGRDQSALELLENLGLTKELVVA